METFSALLAICVGNSPVAVNSPHKGQWRGALMFSLICAWINGWVNAREAGDLRRNRAHYDVNVMFPSHDTSYQITDRPQYTVHSRTWWLDENTDSAHPRTDSQIEMLVMLPGFYLV